MAMTWSVIIGAQRSMLIASCGARNRASFPSSQSIRHGCRNAEASCFRDPAELLHFNQGCCRWATNPDKCGLYQQGILLVSLLWAGLPGEKSKLKVRAGRAGGSHHKARHCWCDDPLSRWRGGRRRCMGRRHLPHRSFVSERNFKPQGVHWALGFYGHKL